MNLAKSPLSKQKTLRPSLLVLFLITGLGTFLRFHALTARSMWLDETWMVAFSKLPLADILRGKIGGGQWFFVLILKTIGLSTGYSEATMRFLPFLAGSLLIPLSYVFARHFLDTAGSLLVSGLLAICPITIVYSQECANYSLWMITVTLYFLFILDYTDAPERKSLFLFALTSLVATYLHSYNVFIMASVVAYFCMSHGFKREFKNFYFTIPLLGLLSIPRLLADQKVARALNDFHKRNPEPANLPWQKTYQAFRDLVFSWLHGPSNSIYTPQSSLTFIQAHETLITILILAIFLFSIIHSLMCHRGYILLLTTVILTHACALVYYCVKTVYPPDRYGLPIIPLYLILLVRGFYPEQRRLIISKVFGAIVLGAVFINFATIEYQNYDKPLLWKPDWRELCQTIRTDANKLGNNRFSIFVPDNTETSLIYFYLPDYSSHVLADSQYYSYLYNPKYLWLSTDEIKQYHLATLDQAKGSPIDVLYVPTHRGRSRMDYIHQYLVGQFELEKMPDAAPPWLYIYKRRKAIRAL